MRRQTARLENRRSAGIGLNERDVSAPFGALAREVEQRPRYVHPHRAAVCADKPRCMQCGRATAAADIEYAFASLERERFERRVRQSSPASHLWRRRGAPTRRRLGCSNIRAVSDRASR